MKETNLTFSEALRHLKEGWRMTRKNWNGKGQFIFLAEGYPEGIGANKNTAKAMCIEEGDIVKCRPYLVIRTAQGDIVPWLASQSDLLEDDWEWYS